MRRQEAGEKPSDKNGEEERIQEEEREKRLEKARNLEKGWELLRICKEMIEKDGVKWNTSKERKEDEEQERKKEENRNG